MDSSLSQGRRFGVTSAAVWRVRESYCHAGGKAISPKSGLLQQRTDCISVTGPLAHCRDDVASFPNSFQPSINTSSGVGEGSGLSSGLELVQAMASLTKVATSWGVRLHHMSSPVFGSVSFHVRGSQPVMAAGITRRRRIGRRRYGNSRRGASRASAIPAPRRRR